MPTKYPELKRSIHGRHYGSGILVALAIPLSSLLEPPIGPNLALVDVFILPMIVLGAASLIRRASPARRTVAKSMPWLWLILLGSTASLFGVGIPIWSLDTTARGLLSFAAFFSAWHLLCAHTDAIRLGQRMSVWAGLLVAASVLVDGALRATGTFSNPNYAGHFLALSVPFIVSSRFRPITRVVIVGLLVGALIATLSFAAWAMVLGALAYQTLRAPAMAIKRPTQKVLRVGILMGLLASLAAATVISQPDSEDSGVPNAELAAHRFDSSSTTRVALWSGALALVPEYPLGVAPGGMVNRPSIMVLPERSANAHNDFLGYLVERGVIGLIGLCGLAYRLWAASVPSGLARVVLVEIGIGGFFHSTLHYRHLWLLLALAYAVDAISHRKGSAEAPGRVRFA